MASLTPNYSLILPSVNDPTNQDLWGGMLNSNFAQLDTIIRDIAIKEPYPVGSLYFNADVATNPATLLGYGTWVEHGAGRVLVGVGTTTDERGESRTFADGDSGGNFQHVLTEAQMPEHDHSLGGNMVTREGPSVGPWESGGNARTFSRTQMTGGGQPHNNIQPFITVYIWRRTA